MPIIRTHENNVETVCYGEILGCDLKNVFTYELKHYQLNDIEDDDTRRVQVQYINFENYYLLIISFDGVEMLEEKKKHGSSSHMNFILSQYEDEMEEEEEEEEDVEKTAVLDRAKAVVHKLYDFIDDDPNHLARCYMKRAGEAINEDDLEASVLAVEAIMKAVMEEKEE